MERDASTRVVSRVAGILRLLTSNPGCVTSTEAAKRLNLARSTAHRLMSDLQKEGLLRRDVLGSGEYRPGFMLLQLAEAAKAGFEILELARPHMVYLRDVTRETVALHVLDGVVRRCVLQVESPEPLRRVYPDLGSAIPLHTGAASLAILAYLPDETIDMILKRPLEMLAPNTITDSRQIREELEGIKQHGFCVSSQQRSVGVGAVAAPLFTADGGVVGSLNVTGPVDRFTEDKVQLYSQLLRQACDRISASFGSEQNHRR